MKLYGHPVSTYTKKVLMLGFEKNVDIDLVVVELFKGEHKQPAHVARHPFGKVPAFEDDDGFRLYESRAILRYLDERLPGASLTPADAKGRALMEQWASVEANYFTPESMKIISQRIFAPIRGNKPDEAIVADGRTSTGKVLDVLDAQLAKTRFLAGDGLTLADIGYIPYIDFLFKADAGDLLMNRANVARWWKDASERASWQKVLAKVSAK